MQHHIDDELDDDKLSQELSQHQHFEKRHHTADDNESLFFAIHRLVNIIYLDDVNMNATDIISIALPQIEHYMLIKYRHHTSGAFFLLHSSHLLLFYK